MDLPKFARFPVLIEHEVGGVLVVLVEGVVDAARFRECWLDEFEQLCFD